LIYSAFVKKSPAVYDFLHLRENLKEQMAATPSEYGYAVISYTVKTGNLTAALSF